VARTFKGQNGPMGPKWPFSFYCARFVGNGIFTFHNKARMFLSRWIYRKDAVVFSTFIGLTGIQLLRMTLPNLNTWVQAGGWSGIGENTPAEFARAGKFQRTLKYLLSHPVCCIDFNSMSWKTNRERHRNVAP
jgi:hypothetical protein